MSVLEKSNAERVKTDVLVIGGGIAGCFAAIKARESGLDVVLVDKGNVGRSGISHQMSGILTYSDPEKDDYDDWFREGVEAGDWMCDQKRLESMFYESTERIRELERWGVTFLKEGGEFLRRHGVGHHHGWIVVMPHGAFQLMSVLRGEVLRRGVRVIERVMATNLLTSDGEVMTSGRIVGAVGLNIRNGKFYIFEARATIIAAGATYIAFPTKFMPNLSGDGRAMAFQAGCEMRSLEFCEWSPLPTSLNCAPGMNILVGEDTHFINAKGDRFMPKWDPVRMERAPRAVVFRAMLTEELEGRGPICWDATHLSEAAHNRIRMAIPIVIRSLAAIGLDFQKDKIPYSYRLHDMAPGGIRVDKDNATNIPGLYAAGSASDHGELGTSTEAVTPGMGSAIGGYRAGEAAAKYTREIEGPTINEHQVRIFKEEVFAPMKRKSGLTHEGVRRNITNIGEKYFGPIRNDSSLKCAIDAAKEIRENEIPKLIAKDYHELARCIGIGNALLLYELLPRAALLRTESRGPHYRTDYPERDDVNWLKWVIAKKDDNDTKIWTEPIPFQEYRLKLKPEPKVT